ncbi:MAG: hypothetical protein CVU98_07150 [Firmicutes bacterium HGW-Firmicutes-3]|jgi:hypothetical protein|nr:MAG: hypothetical protein CVU98_07150 [Firmicutes bacterium HGW-Firmicutes-3]
MVRKILLLIIIFLFQSVNISADSIVSIDSTQVELKMPELNIFFNTVNENNQVITPSFDTKDITILIDNQTYKDGFLSDALNENSSTHCLFLVDISKSMSSDQMMSIRNFMKKWSETKAIDDQIGIITFGDSIKIAQEFTEDVNHINAAIETIRPTDNSTAFLESIHKGLQLIRQKESKLSGRRIIVVFSDGENEETGGITFQEVLETLKVSNIPVYGIGTAVNPNTKQQEYLDNFAHLARTSGGKYYQVSVMDFGMIYEDLTKRMTSQYIYKIQMKDNKMDYELKKATVIIDNGLIKIEDSAYFINNSNIEDTIPPSITEWFYEKSSNHLSIEFTEEILGIENIDNILVNGRSGSEVIESIDASSENIVRIYFKEDLLGAISIELKNITDASNEKNPLDQQIISFEVEADLEETNNVGDSSESNSKKLLTIIGIVIGALIVVIAIVIFSRRRKQNGLQLLISYHNEVDKTKGNFKIDLSKSSVLAGRSSECNLLLTDTKMSRQHFRIYYHEGNILLEDLNSSNGIYFGDQKLMEPAVLNEGYTFKAGNTNFLITVDI